MAWGRWFRRVLLLFLCLEGKGLGNRCPTPIHYWLHLVPRSQLWQVCRLERSALQPVCSPRARASHRNSCSISMAALARRFFATHPLVLRRLARCIPFLLQCAEADVPDVSISVDYEKLPDVARLDDANDSVAVRLRRLVACALQMAITQYAANLVDSAAVLTAGAYLESGGVMRIAPVEICPPQLARRKGSALHLKRNMAASTAFAPAPWSAEWLRTCSAGTPRRCHACTKPSHPRPNTLRIYLPSVSSRCAHTHVMQRRAPSTALSTQIWMKLLPRCVVHVARRTWSTDVPRVCVLYLCIMNP